MALALALAVGWWLMAATRRGVSCHVGNINCISLHLPPPPSAFIAGEWWSFCQCVMIANRRVQIRVHMRIWMSVWVCQCECSVRVLADDLSCCVNSTADRAISLADNLSGISPTGNSLSHLTVETYIPHPESPHRVFKLKRKLCTGEQSQHNFLVEMRISQKLPLQRVHFRAATPTPPRKKR